MGSHRNNARGGGDIAQQQPGPEVTQQERSLQEAARTQAAERNPVLQWLGLLMTSRRGATGNSMNAATSRSVGNCLAWKQPKYQVITQEEEEGSREAGGWTGQVLLP